MANIRLCAANYVAAKTTKYYTSRVLIVMETLVAASIQARGRSQFATPRGPVPGFIKLGGSVGTKGGNAAADTKAVQVALNAVVPALGGPSPLLAVDGICGSKTKAAIQAIQGRWTASRDGRIDPGGATIKVLNRLAGMAASASPAAPSPFVVRSLSRTGSAFGSAAPAPTPPTPPPAPSPGTVRAQNRLLFAQQVVMPIAVTAMVTALLSLAAAQRHLGTILAGRLPTPDAARSDGRFAFLAVAKHFRLHERAPNAALDAVQQVTAAFLRMRDMVVSRTVTVGGKPSFDRMYSIPGDIGFVPPPGATIAYVGRVSGALTPGQPDGSSVPGSGGQGTMPELCDGVYLLDGFDTVPSLHIPVMLHELAHLSGGPGPNSMILDQVFASEAAFEAQTTQQRLINVQCYEFYATEVLLGTGLSAVAFGKTMAWMTRTPVCLGGGRFAVPPTLMAPPDPLAFPSGFA